MSFAVGDVVRLVRTPGVDGPNPFVEGKTATILSLESWGAFVRTDATKTGQYRAGWDEMEPLGMVDHAVVEALERSLDQHLNAPALVNGVQPHRGIPPVAQTSGEVCTQCGSLSMMRAGSCLTCVNCGAATGCS